MPPIFEKLDKAKPVYDAVEHWTMFVCKVLLAIDILVTGYVVVARWLAFLPSTSWSEEVVLTCMAYMAVLSAAVAIRRGTHIRMTAFDRMLPKKFITITDFISDIAVLVLAIIMIVVGWQYAVNIGSKGTYVTLTSISKFWMYLPVPLAGFAMVVFQIELLYNHVKDLFVAKVAKQEKGEEA